MREKDTTSPPGSGMQPPESPVPAPRAVIGTLCAAATRTIAATCAVSDGNTTASGSCAAPCRDSSAP